MVEVIKSFLRGLERPLILWLLSKRTFHGYGIIKELREHVGIEVKPSVLYPFLHQLEDTGFIAGRWIKEGGRNVKYYSLTSKGEILLNKMKEFFRESLREVIMDIIQ